LLKTNSNDLPFDDNGKDSKNHSDKGASNEENEDGRTQQQTENQGTKEQQQEDSFTSANSELLPRILLSQDGDEEDVNIVKSQEMNNNRKYKYH